MHHGLKREGGAVGTDAGPYAVLMTKQRDEEQAAYEAKKKKIQQDHARGVGKIDEKFNSVPNQTLY